jgi:uncharacterized protein (TIGR03067 family)
MRMRTLLSAALCAATMSAVSVAGARAAEPALAGDLAKLQGQWTATFGPQNIVVVLTIKGNGAVLAFTRADGQSLESKGEIKIDETAKPQKTLDWVKFTTPAGDTAPANLGIYKLNADSITICNGGPGNERPAEFKAGEGGQPQLFVLNRKTAAAAAAAATTGGDLAKMQGRWTAKVGPNKNATLTITIKGTSIQFVIPTADGTPREPKGEIKIDENAKPQKTLDWLNLSGASGQTAPPILGIYKFDGDTLTICSGGLGGDRPTEFKAGEGNKPNLIVLNRE